MNSSIKARRSRNDGETAQDIVEQFMKANGFQCVERIETGFGLVRRGKHITGAYPKRSVSGDIKAIGRKGRAVHVEVKYRPDTRLKWSDFAPHQIEALQAVTEARGEAYVAWVVSLSPATLYWLQWPIPKLRKGHALYRSDAELLRDDWFGFVEGVK